MTALDIPDFARAVAILPTGLASAVLADLLTAPPKPRVEESLVATPRRVNGFAALLLLVDFLLIAAAVMNSLHYIALLAGSFAVGTTAIIMARQRRSKSKSSPAGFEYDATAETMIRFQGRRYLVGVHGVRAMQLVIDMANAIEGDSPNPSALLRFRRRIREVLQAPPRAVLAYFAAQTRDLASRRLAVWLRGRCRGTLGTMTFDQLWTHADPTLRKELARAFKRMDAWDHLRRIEESDPDPRIRRIARQSSPRSFDSRLAGFLSGVTPSEASTSESGLVVRDDFDPTGGLPAKPRWLIRRLLEHIRSLVHGPYESAPHGD
jgi:hypothetical protein